MRHVFQSKKLKIFLLFLTFCLPVKAANNCLQFSVVGICYWYYYYGSSTTVLYGHFNPDVIVDITNPQGADQGESHRRMDSQNLNHKNLIFHDAKSYGHPLTGQIYCPSNTSALSPYFTSALDATAWRWGVPDILTKDSLIPGLKEIGNWPTNTWGALYPRTGWTTQYSQPKAAGIAAQRVGDIITRKSEPHVYRSILGRSVITGDGKITWTPSSLNENTSKDGWWQLNYLNSTASECLIFGEDDTSSSKGWGGGKVQKEGDYRYTLWRPYTCCEIDVGVLIKIQISPFPVIVVSN